jgi:hypothetical protein
MPENTLFTGRVQPAVYQRANRHLMEGLFFHRSDNPDLFAALHRNRDVFKQFWTEQLGIDLVVKEHVAYRVHENRPEDPYTGFANPQIPNQGRLHLYWRGPRGKLCLLVFQKFLYYYESKLRRDEEQPFGEHAFLSHHFWVWVNDELTAFFAGRESAPKPHEIHAAIRQVLSDLEGFGFIRTIESRKLTPAERASISGNYELEHIIHFHARPGLGAYDGQVLQQDPTAFAKAYGWATDEPTTIEPITDLEDEP